GKGSFNVIKDAVELEGDVRSMSEEARNIIQKEITRIVSGIEAMFGVTCELDYKNDYPVLNNDEALTDFVVKSIKGAKI
ncbi:amidohydrolase, partial [Escherichia coli]|nr:amidohydrolase [Escherichia coli]